MPRRSRRPVSHQGHEGLATKLTKILQPRSTRRSRGENPAPGFVNFVSFVANAFVVFVADGLRGLPVFPFEFPHELHERIDPFLGERVVDRGPYAPDRAVSLEAIETGGRRLFHEKVFQPLASQPEY